MTEVASSLTSPRPSSASSPPPKCAICLGTCTNKCFSDSCMHQFCFTCLLEWSKVKAECPLCKQSFKSIIHNIKSNDEYDEHFVEVPEHRAIIDSDDAGFLFLPPAPSRHFQFRTTFTVDTGGELAIQQMLLSHPLTNTLYNAPGNYTLPRYPRLGGNRRTPRRASSATSFRRWVYASNMWVYAPPDITGRYRDVSPIFYRDNPAARNRLVPWLNRELNALLRENTQQVMHLVDVIMEHLTRCHIRSRSFKNLLSPHFGSKTHHFIHEFYNFMRSPFDMIGYDRHIIYTDRPYSPTYILSDPDDDSDVAIINVTEPVGANNNPFRRPTIEVIEIDSDSSRDSDVIIRESPIPEVVLVDSDSSTEIESRTPEPRTSNNDNTNANTNNTNSNSNRNNYYVCDSSIEEESEDNRKPVLPLKIRLKHKRQSRERRSRNKKCCSKCRYSSGGIHSSTTSSEWSRDSSTSSDSSCSRSCKRKRKYKKFKRGHRDSKSRKEKSKLHNKSTVISDGNSSEDSNASRKAESDTDDSIPLSKLKSIDKRKKLKRSRSTVTQSNSKTHTATTKNIFVSSDDEVVAPPTTVNNSPELLSKPSCSRWKSPEVNIPPIMGNLNSSPVNLSLSNNSVPNGEYHFPDSVAHFKYEQYNSQNDSLPQFDNIPHYESFQPYAQYDYTSRYNPVTVGNRYYDGPDYNLPRPLESFTPPTPPIAHTNGSGESSNPYSTCLFRGDIYQQQTETPTPSRVNIGVGTSPVKKELNEPSSYGYYVPGPSGSSRLQSVIVKKENNKDNPQLCCGFYLSAATSDSDS